MKTTSLTEEQIRDILGLNRGATSAGGYVIRAQPVSGAPPFYYNQWKLSGYKGFISCIRAATRFPSTEEAKKSPFFTNAPSMPEEVVMEVIPAPSAAIPERRRDDLETLGWWSLSPETVQRAAKIVCQSRPEEMREIAVEALATSFLLDGESQRALALWALAISHGCGDIRAKTLTGLLNNPVLAETVRTLIGKQAPDVPYDKAAETPTELAKYRGEVIRIICEAPTISPEIALNLVKGRKGSAAVARRLLANPGLSEKTKAQISSLVDNRSALEKASKESLARRKELLDTDPDLLTADDRRFLFQIHVGRCQEHAVSGKPEAIPPDLLEKAVRCFDDGVRKVIAGHPSLTGSQLRKLACDAAPGVRVAVFSRADVLAAIERIRS